MCSIACRPFHAAHQVRDLLLRVAAGALWWYLIGAIRRRGAHFSEGPDDVHAAFADANLTDRLRIIDPGEITGF